MVAQMVARMARKVAPMVARMGNLARMMARKTARRAAMHLYLVEPFGAESAAWVASLAAARERVREHGSRCGVIVRLYDVPATRAGLLAILNSGSGYEAAQVYGPMLRMWSVGERGALVEIRPDAAAPAPLERRA